MKVEIVPEPPKPPKPFEPVHIDLVIESEDELLALYHRVVLSWCAIEKARQTEESRFPLPPLGGNLKCYELWEVLHDILAAQE